MFPIDHVVIAVPDLGVAGADLTSAGFTVSPLADHPFGTSNRLVVLEDSYIELVSVTRPDSLTGAFATAVRDRVAQGGGIVAVALRSNDVPADRDGFPAVTTEPFDFSRAAPLADGTQLEASFTLSFLPQAGPTSFFLCQHHTPESVWHPALVSHPNSARSVTAVGVGDTAPAWPLDPRIRFESAQSVALDADIGMSLAGVRIA